MCKCSKHIPTWKLTHKWYVSRDYKRIVEVTKRPAFWFRSTEHYTVFCCKCSSCSIAYKPRFSQILIRSSAVRPPYQQTCPLQLITSSAYMCAQTQGPLFLHHWYFYSAVLCSVGWCIYTSTMPDNLTYIPLHPFGTPTDCLSFDLLPIYDQRLCSALYLPLV